MEVADSTGGQREKDLEKDRVKEAADSSGWTARETEAVRSLGAEDCPAEGNGLQVARAASAN